MALKLSFYCFDVVRYDSIVGVSIFPMCYSTVTDRTDGHYIQWMIRSVIAKCLNMVNFEIRFSVAAHKRRRAVTAFAISM